MFLIWAPCLGPGFSSERKTLLGPFSTPKLGFGSELGEKDANICVCCAKIEPSLGA